MATPAAAASSPWGVTSSADAIEQLLDFGEYAFAGYFSEHVASASTDRFRYRYYPTTGVYLGVAESTAPGDGLVQGGVYVMGGPFGDKPLFVGTLTERIVPMKSGFEAAPTLLTPFLDRLPVMPKGVGATCADRTAWAGAAAKVAAITLQADGQLTKAFPAWSDEAYLGWSRSGQPAAGEAMINARKAWLFPLVIAECAAWQGKYLDAIRMTLRELANQPSWIVPRSDTALRAYSRRDWFVDLWSADMAHDLAQTLYLLGDKVDAETRSLVMDALEARVFKPMRDTFDNRFVGGDHWWLTATNNQNAVCLKGVVGAALTVLPSRRDRARFAAAGQHYTKYFVAGFPDSGYSPEGVGYWNYGVGHYATLRTMLFAASAGQVDLFASAKVQSVALYASRSDMTPTAGLPTYGGTAGAAPFGDAPTSPNNGVYPEIRALVQRIYGDDTVYPGTLRPNARQFGNDSPVVAAAMLLTDRPPHAAGFETTQFDWPGLSTYFADIGLLVTRSPRDQVMPLAATIKSGGNTTHGHDDVGSYAIALGTEQPTGDVGVGQYAARTFSDQRRTIQWINSYGHPVPVVGGRRQSDATGAKNTVTSTSFSDAADAITIDMAPAYGLPQGWVLSRTLRNDRPARTITISDDFQFSEPQTFEVALTTVGGWQQTSITTLELWQKSARLKAAIEASAPYIVTSEVIEDDGLKFHRIAIRLQVPAAAGWVRVRFTP